MDDNATINIVKRIFKTQRTEEQTSQNNAFRKGVSSHMPAACSVPYADSVS